MKPYATTYHQAESCRVLKGHKHPDDGGKGGKDGEQNVYRWSTTLSFLANLIRVLQIDGRVSASS